MRVRESLLADWVTGGLATRTGGMGMGRAAWAIDDWGDQQQPEPERARVEGPRRRAPGASRRVAQAQQPSGLAWGEGHLRAPWLALA